VNGRVRPPAGRAWSSVAEAAADVGDRGRSLNGPISFTQLTSSIRFGVESAPALLQQILEEPHFSEHAVPKRHGLAGACRTSFHSRFDPTPVFGECAPQPIIRFR